MKGEKPIRILHVDDEKSQLEFTKLFLEEIDKDIIVDSAESPKKAVELQKKNKYDCVVSDYKMLEMNGIELAQKVRENSTVPFILYTGQGSEEVAESAFEAGVDDYLRKENEPSHYQVLAKRVRQNVEKHRSDQLYRKVVDESRDGILIISGDEIAFINSAASKLFDVTETKKLLGKKITNLFLEGKETLLKKLEKCCESPLTNVIEINYRTNQDVFRVAEISVSKIEYLGEEAYLCFIRDITRKKRNIEQLDAIHKQASKLSMLQTINEIAETTLKILESVFELQVSSFHILENENLRTIGVRGGPSVKITLPLKGKGIIEKAAREKHSLLIKDIRKSSDYKKGKTKSKSQLAVPAVIDGETVAVINVESRHINEFTEEDRKLLETLAFHVSFAIDRIHKKGMKFDPQMEESFRLEYALGRLEDAESISHLVKNELQVSLQSIKNASEILKDQPERIIDFTAAIDRKAEQAVNISEEIHETVTKGSIDWDLIEINQVIKQTISSFHFPANIEVHTRYLDELIIVNTDHKKFARVITNIMRNSVEAMPNGGKLTIHVRHHAANVIIDIKDTGIGIPEEVKDRLFEPFNSTKPNHEGLGLAYSYNEIISAGGNLSIVSERGEGTIVTISLPVKKKLDTKNKK